MTDLELFTNEFAKCSIIPKVVKQNTPYNFIVGGRNGHKSTEMQIFLFIKFLENNEQFLLLRRKTSHTVNTWLSSYFNKLLEKSDYYIEFKAKMLKTDKHTGYFIVKKHSDNKYNQIWGKVAFLSVEDTYRSNEIYEMQELKYIVNEECIATDNYKYLPNEPQKIVDTISTFARSKNVITFFIGNTNPNQENNPLFHFYGLDEWEYKQGDLIVDYLDGTTTKATLYLPFNLEKTQDYQQVKGNNVGINGEWKQPKRYLNNPLSFFLNVSNPYFEIVYKNKKYYLYSVLDKNNNSYYYITNEFYLRGRFPNNIDELKKQLPIQHKNYSNELLRCVYPQYFDINCNFINLNPPIKITKVLLGNVTQYDIIKNDNNNKRDKLIQLLIDNYYYCNKKTLLFELETIVKDNIKEVL